MKTILILEDSEDRIAAFQQAVDRLGDGFELKIWRDAPSMMAECEQYFSSAALISLDHDLNRQPGATTDPGTGLAVAQFLADFMPFCQVLIHTSSAARASSMHNELRFTGWTADRIEPLGVDWIEARWLLRVCELLSACPNCWKVNLPPDHISRIERMRLSLDGLGLGDALGEMLAYRYERAPKWFAENEYPIGTWFHTDDTEMAISVAAVLKSYGKIDQDALSRRFARRFERDPNRGYGKMTRIQMRQILSGAKWRVTAANAFSGNGSMGNGGAMRVAPLGAYFADDVDRCAFEAQMSSMVTHTHSEGIAGTIAVAVAAAMAWQRKEIPADKPGRFFEEILRLTPDGQVRRGILLASQTPFDLPVEFVAKTLGNGSLVTAPDTVPFCIWMAARYPNDFKEALAQTIKAGGDCDTNAAIVGGIVALSAGRERIPVEWLNARERIRVI